MKKLKLFILITLLGVVLSIPSASANEEERNPDLCYNTDWPKHENFSTTRGQTVIYETPSEYKLTSTNLACVVATELITRASKVPARMTVGLVSTDGRQGFIVKWDRDESIFVIMETIISPKEYRGTGTFTVYPDPLERISNIITSTRFPKEHELPLHVRHKLRRNTMNTSVFQLRKLINKTR